MSEPVNKPIILNLAGVLSDKLVSYFAKGDIRVVDPLKESTVLTWTHILVRDVEDFGVIGDTYGTLDNKIKLVSLSQPRDLKKFMLNNGKMVLDESWLTGPFGTFILDKFFQEYGGVNLGDHYPKFSESGSFHVTNPFNTGEYLDHLVYNAFESGMSALSIKTYFDHILMYLTSLKNKGRVGLPIEVSYGTYGDTYGLQMHFFSESMQIEDVTCALSSTISKHPEESLLYIALQSSDFCDFTFLPEVNKVVVTGLWSKDENVKASNKGLMFTVANAATAKTLPLTEAAAPFVLTDGTIEDLSRMVSGEVQIIPAGLPVAEEEIRIIPADALEGEFVTTISGSSEEEEAVTTVSGSSEEEEAVSVVTGAKEEQDKTVTKISGKKDEKKGNMTVKSLGGLDHKTSGMFDFSSPAGADAGKKSASLFKVDGNKREEELQKNLDDVLNQNGELKAKLVTVVSELKGLKDLQAKLKKIADEAGKDASEEPFASRVDEILRVSSANAKEREARLAEEFRQMEKLNRKLKIESAQKEHKLGLEFEKLHRMVTLKDTALEKTKEGNQNALQKKDSEIESLKSKLEQVNKHVAGGLAQVQTASIKELERQITAQEKTIDVYKNKITALSAALEATKVDENSKDDARKLQLHNDQLKTQAEMLRKEIDKHHARSGSDQEQLLALKQEKSKLLDSLKKTQLAVKASQINAAASASEVEVKRLHGQLQQLETYLKEANTKVKDLEIKLQNVTAANRTNQQAEDGQTKIRLSHLENSVKKLTQDLLESRNQQAELKKETNKLRQDKTALQNTLDKAKKDLEKYEKKPASGKKAS